MTAPAPLFVEPATPQQCGIDPEDLAPGAALFWATWPDRAGYYERGADGFYACAVENDTECFETPQAAQAWLWERLGKLI